MMRHRWTRPSNVVFGALLMVVGMGSNASIFTQIFLTKKTGVGYVRQQHIRRKNECPVATCSASSNWGSGGGEPGGKAGSKGKNRWRKTGSEVNETWIGGTTGGNRDLQEEAVVGEGSKTSTATGAETLSTTTTKADETLPSMGETALVNEATSLLRSLKAEASKSLWTEEA